MIRFWITSSRKSISSGIILKVQHWPLSVITGENILEQSLSSPPKWHLKFKGFWWLNLSSQRLIWISASLDYIVRFSIHMSPVHVVLVSLLVDQLSVLFLIFWKDWTKNSREWTKKIWDWTNFFFGRPKKMRNRPDNWSTKRLTKTTWTGL